MTITYRLGDSLYVNMTNRCSNRCDFCIRNFGTGIGDSGDLWLEREPTVEETADDILKNAGGCREIVFCGYGEPLIRLDDVLAVVRRVKPALGLPVRINTNGQADLIHGRATARELAGLIDTVSISLNAPDAEGYDQICHSDYGAAAFDAVLAFARDCKNYVKSVIFSVVDVMPPEEIEKCRELARKAGVFLRVRGIIK